MISVTIPAELYAKLVDTLAMYADPETYHAMMIIFDPPCGVFKGDFGPQSEHEHPDYEDDMPGKAARAVIKELNNAWGPEKPG